MKALKKGGKFNESLDTNVPENFQTQPLKEKIKEHVLRKENVNQINIENENLITDYGMSMYKILIERENNFVTKNLFQKHKIEAKVRTKMVDWMIEVLATYRAEPRTLFLAVNLMDMYIKKSPKILDNTDVHLLGVTSMFVMSKYEDVIPLRISSVYHKICHKAFSETQIQEMERKILVTLDWNIDFVSCYDFIKTYIYDFLINNKHYINELKMNQVILNLENIAVYFAKLTLHSELFSGYLSSLKAICCIVAARDALVSHSKTLTGEMNIFLKNWILFLINESIFEMDFVKKAYNELMDFYHFQYEQKKRPNQF